MRCKIEYTAVFFEFVKREAIYIRENAQSQQVAQNFVKNIRQAIEKLIEFPELGVLPRNKSLRLRRYRVLIVGKYLIFYVFLEKERVVTIHRLVNGRQDYQYLL